MRIQSLRSSVPVSLYSAEQVRLLDAAAIKTMGQVDGYGLMREAGQASVRVMRQRYPDVERVTVCCGGGNNGGDGYVVAEILHRAGVKVQLLVLVDPAKLSGEAKQAMEDAVAEGVTLERWTEQTTIEGQLIVDALLGTGLKGEVRQPFSGIIEAINQSDQPVLALDIPSGLSADKGLYLGCAVKADSTITFIGIKKGLLTGQACDYVGDLWFDDLKVPNEIYEAQTASAERINLSQAANWLSPRQKSSHKGDFGRVLVVGGDFGFGGAAIMSAEAAYSAGAGLVTCATQGPHVIAGLSRAPDIMYRDAEQRSVLLELLERADIVVLGPGLGQNPWGQMCFHECINSGKPLVLDADGLNLLAASDSKTLPENSVITPHPGEAARLLKKSTYEIVSDRYAAVEALSEKYKCSALLKGFGTLIKGIGSTPVAVVAEHGNPGMAKGGMGDVLSGIIGALLAQGMTSNQAAQLAACWHAGAADEFAQSQGETSVVASRLCDLLGPVLKAEVIRN